MTLLELIDLLKKRLKLVVAIPLACALLVGAYTLVFMPNQYTATTRLYVLAGQGETGGNLSTSLSTSQLVASDVVELLKSERVHNAAAEQLGLAGLGDFEVAVSSTATTQRMIELKVTGTDPELVAQVANALAENASATSQDIMNVQAVNIVDQAPTPQAPSGPPRAMYVAVAFMGGLFAAVAFVVVADMLNTKVRSADEVEELLGISVIGRIPAVKGGR